MSPKRVFRYKRERHPRYFRVVGPLHSLDAIAKPIPLGALLTATGEYGRSGNRYYVRLTRRIPARRGPVVLEEWVLTRDLMNPMLAKPCDKRCVLRRKSDRAKAALRAILNFAPLRK
ncbi:MAG: hypothetical protein HYT14_00180 [Candidatus Liptonbacteria bacterium]|nr:hypothetical protein [Candidatus Liptonbacteria bacterium]